MIRQYQVSRLSRESSSKESCFLIQHDMVFCENMSSTAASVALSDVDEIHNCVPFHFVVVDDLQSCLAHDTELTLNFKQRHTIVYGLDRWSS